MTAPSMYRRAWRDLAPEEKREVTQRTADAICNTYKHQEPHQVSAPDRSFQVGGDHYSSQTVQPWDVFDCWPTCQRIGAYRSAATKYLMRMGSKGDALEDARKARHYLDKLISVFEEPEVDY